MLLKLCRVKFEENSVKAFKIATETLGIMPRLSLVLKRDELNDSKNPSLLILIAIK
jgi:hypothetical protein